MKKILLFITILFSLIVSSQDFQYKEYSYTKFFELIEQEPDSVFELSDALIKYNPSTDHRFKDTFTGKGEELYNPDEKIIVNKRIELNNVQFLASIYNEVYKGKREGFIDGVLKDIHFKKDVILKEVSSLNIGSSIFDGKFDLQTLTCEPEGVDVLESSQCTIRNSIFKDYFLLFRNCIQGTKTMGHVTILNNKFITKKFNSYLQFGIFNSSSFALKDNIFNVNGTIDLYGESQDARFSITSNDFDSNTLGISFSKLSTKVQITDNQFSTNVNFYTDQLNPKDEIDWSQLRHKLTPEGSFGNYAYDEKEKIRVSSLDSIKQLELKREYLDSVRYHNKKYYVEEIALKGLFYDYYKSKYDTETANEVYLELKDFETKRMQVRFEQEPTFKTFFTWKTNQFLKIFSAYGTEPARAIIFSLYVIIFFAFIYLLFPNSWDSHGKNRIVDRYNFFFKYMKRKAGIHEVYLEDQKEELMSYNQFKENISSSSQKVPKFFTATALPLYKWAISGTKLSSSLLKRVDIMKGTWSELPQSKRIWKSILLVSVFLIAIVYDLFIKALNALMLSINTFTTLGFGEIPIKGLPRYLAIIQGFIGWFMLTIFSVSLISQLLN